MVIVVCRALDAGFREGHPDISCTTCSTRKEGLYILTQVFLPSNVHKLKIKNTEMNTSNIMNL